MAGRLNGETLKLGFVGAGRMATALARGCVEAGLVDAENLLACDPAELARARFGENLPGSRISAEATVVFAEANTVVLAVKPQAMSQVLDEIHSLVEPRHLLVSIAAGVTIDRIAAKTPPETRLIRVMPNTPCLIGSGASCLSRGPAATDADAALVWRILASVGEVHEVQETQLDAVTGLSGSGPAFVYTVIESLAAGGAEMGLPADLSLALAAQTVLGAAAMVQSTGMSPAALRDQVASPGGTTLAGLESLERDDVAASLQRAVAAAARRSNELGH